MKPTRQGELGDTDFDGETTWLCMGGAEWVDHLPVEELPKSKYATVHNAEAIRDCNKRALTCLNTAERELNDALMLARDDYDHNADQLEQIVGALGLLQSAVGVQSSTWTDRASSRRLHDGSTQPQCPCK